MVLIKRKLVEKLKEHALKEAPKEACGVLAGKDGAVTQVYECGNASECPETTYEIAPAELLKALEDIESKGLELLGFYHSHPMGLDKPSFIDEGRATWHGYSYVVISLPGGSISSWKWREDKGRFEEEEIEQV